MKKGIGFILLFYCQVLLAQDKTSPLPPEKTGVIIKKEGSTEGYILFAPLSSKTTYLIDKCGRLVNSWTSKFEPGQSAYLLGDGSLLRTGKDVTSKFASGGGKIEKFDWNNNLIWSFSISYSNEAQHHDICPMPNGNVLAIVWEKKSAQQALDAGRKAGTADKGMWDEKILELKPVGDDSAVVVWEWHVWDHLIQDSTRNASHYGKVSENPQLFNINYRTILWEDWMHFNAVDYNEKTDQIIVSIRNFSEFFIIDHSTTKKQSESHKGGKRKKGGDILYRWGNPITYNCGTLSDQKLFYQHNAQWIREGDDTGKILVFNNGQNRPGGAYSSVEIIDPPLDKKGNYMVEKGKAFLPVSSEWEYSAPVKSSFYSKNISGAQRLANGNTLVCSGVSARFFEIDKNKNIVWEYISPVVNTDKFVDEKEKVPSQVFRCVYYSPEFSGFKGRNLIHGAELGRETHDPNCK